MSRKSQIAAGKTLKHWQTVGHLTGDGHALTRQSILDAAAAVDAARDDGNAFNLSRSVKVLDELIARNAPKVQEVTGDRFDQWLAQLPAAEVRDQA